MDHLRMDDTDVDQDGPRLTAIGVDSFRDLLKGNIDIIEYLNSGPGSAGGGSTESIQEEVTRATVLSKMDMNSLLAAAGGNGVQQQQFYQLQQQQQQQNGQMQVPAPPSRPVLQGQTAGITAGIFSPHHPGRRRISHQPTMPYGQPATRVSESPPETDSGAGSSGSPSRSDPSPYSPEFRQQFHNVHLQPANGARDYVQTNMTCSQIGTGQTQQLAGASSLGRPTPESMLNFHNLDRVTPPMVNDYMSLDGNPRVSNQLNGHWGPSGTSEFSAMPVTAIGQSSNGTVVTNENGGTNSRFMNSGQEQQIATTSAISNHGYSSCILPASHSAWCPNEESSQRKRARTDNGVMVKPEPNSPTGRTSEESVFYDDSMAGNQQTIKFSEFQKEQWFTFCDSNGREMQPLGFAVVADKGFNYSQFDATFVNQKKNHFQVSVHIEVRDPLSPRFVRVPSENGVMLKPISEFQLDVYGVKAELLSSFISIKQSQTDRKPICYEPVKLDLPPNRVTKVTVARLHFSETTMNNQRKNGRPNPDQKYFYLVVSLNAVLSGNEKYMITSHCSDRVIVRASNPGQFDSTDTDVHWQKGQTLGSIYHPGPIGIGTDTPTAALSVTGDIACTGTVYHPSDARLKQNIQELNCAEALSKLSQMRVVEYEIRPEIAEQWGLSEEERRRVGVIAQEVEEILPDAVRENGEYLTVDDNRIFYESAAAVKELCRLTGNLEYKIEEVEKISKKLSRLSYLRRLTLLRSNESVNSRMPPDSICEGSNFTCSQSSLATVTSQMRRKSESPEQNGKGNAERKARNRHRHQCTCRRLSMGDHGGPCSNKVIQSSIIILVIVMAFCLLSMATLYILDWHKRNIAPGTSAHSPFASSNIVHPSDILHTTNNGTAKGDGGNDIGFMKMTVAPPQRPLWPFGPLSSKLPKPLHSSCVKLPCVEFCCPNSYTYYLIGPNGNQTIDHADRDQISSENVEVIVHSQVEQHANSPWWNLPPIGTGFKSRYLNMVGVKVNGLWRRKPAPDDTEGKSGSIQNHAQAQADGRIQKRLAKVDYVAPSQEHTKETTDRKWPMYEAPAVIRIPGLNETIDSRYCVENSCGDAKRGNFTYYIPVSKYMPRIPLDIQFKVESTEIVQYCLKLTGEYCYGLEEAYNENNNGENNPAAKLDVVSEVQPKYDGIWELPVGVYQTSEYRFRVGTTTKICSLPDDEAGATFVEYNVRFFRTCV